MPTNFSASAYRSGLQTLLTAQGVSITVEGFTGRRDYDKFDTPIAELQIESVRTEQNGELRTLDVFLVASLIVMRRLDENEAEEEAFELALDVATALVDEIEDPEGTPVLEAGPILVRSIEPEQPDGALQHRVVAFAVNYEHAMRIRRTNVIAEPDPLTGLWVGRDPNVGPDHVDDYTQIVTPDVGEEEG